MCQHMLFCFCDFLLLRKITFHYFSSIKFGNILLKQGFKFVLKPYKTLKDTVFLAGIRTTWSELGTLNERYKMSRNLVENHGKKPRRNLLCMEIGKYWYITRRNVLLPGLN